MTILPNFFECVVCGKVYNPKNIRYVCDCGNILDIKYDYDKFTVSRSVLASRPMGVWRYKELLPVERLVSFNEGGTGLYKCQKLGAKLGLKELYVKNEGENPTGSFKDRGMTVGVSKAVELKTPIVGCASTGNTSASLASYSARAGLACVVFIPSGKIALGKLAQALMYGAIVCAIKGNFDDAMMIAQQLGGRGALYLLNSINPYRLEGQKTLGYEIFDQLGAIDRVVIPVGNAGNISAVWKAATEYTRFGWLERSPRMCGIQSIGAAPLATMFKENLEVLSPVETPETIATAIRIGNPVSWIKAIRAVRESDGLMETVTDEEILRAQKLLATTEGIFVEPASAASIAGLVKLVGTGVIASDERIVCITTGHGLKDPETAIEQVKSQINYVDNDLNTVLSIIKKQAR